MKKIFLLTLFLLWLLLVCSYIRNSQLGFTNLGEQYSIDRLTGLRSGKLLEEEVVRGEFHSGFRNLAAVGIRFGSIDSDNDDRLKFRLREADHEYIYEAEFEVNQFQQDSFFWFRFPLIADSVGRRYQFEIESINGSGEKPISFDTTFPTIIASYSLAEGQSSNYKALFYFLPRKLLNLAEDQKFLINFFVYSLPFVTYLLFLLSGTAYIIPTLLVLSAIWGDILFIRGTYDFLLVSIIFAWSLQVVKFKIGSRVSLTLAVIFLWTTLIFLLSGRETWSDKTMVWLFLFLFFFSLQKMLEIKMALKENVSVSDFWKNLAGSVYNGVRSIFFLIRGDYKVAENILGLYTTINPILLLRLGWTLRHLLLLVIYLFPFWLFWQMIEKTIGSVRFYRDFFPASADQLFFWRTGVYLTLLVFLAFVSFIFLKRRFIYVRGIVFLIMISLLASQISDNILSQTTRFRYDVVAWKVRGNETAEPWVDVFVSGRNFRDRPFVGKVLVNGVEQRIIGWYDREIIFRTDPHTTTSGKLEVVTDDGRKSNQLDFKYYGGG